MSRLHKAVVGAASVMLTILHTAMAEPLPDDPGAGPINVQMSECLGTAQQNSPKYAEPALASDGASPQLRVEAHLNRAMYFSGLQDPDKARKEIDAALDIDRDNLRATHLSARLALTVGDTDQAEKDIRLALSKAPDDASINMTYALVLQSRRAFTESDKIIERVVEKHPDDLFAREQRAALMTFFSRWDGRPAYEKALADYNFVVERSPPDATMLARRGQTYLALGKADAAVADYSAALKIAPGSIWLMADRAAAYAAAAQDDLAVKDLDELLGSTTGIPTYAMMPDQRARLLTQRANSLGHLRRFQEAATDTIAAAAVGGTSAVLRLQVFLRRNGFPDVPIDGKDSAALRQAIAACFGLNACFQGIMRAI
jgi:tetratricopeptide (TPR) repeat protein